MAKFEAGGFMGKTIVVGADEGIGCPVLGLGSRRLRSYET